MLGPIDLQLTIDDNKTSGFSQVLHEDRFLLHHGRVCTGHHSGHQHSELDLLPIDLIVPAIRIAPAVPADLPSLERDGEYSVRVTLQRIIFDKADRVKIQERITSPEIYQQVFDKLRQSLFYEVSES